MRKILFLAGSLMVAAVLGAGCAGPEQKLGRGFSNVSELTRGGEFDRAIEQDGVFMGTEVGVHTGAIQGFDRTLSRVGMGVFEIVTFPIPPYEPILTKWVKPTTSYPDSYSPHVYSVPEFDVDHELGFSGGEVGFFVPGSRFTIFDN